EADVEVDPRGAARRLAALVGGELVGVGVRWAEQCPEPEHDAAQPEPQEKHHGDAGELEVHRHRSPVGSLAGAPGGGQTGAAPAHPSSGTGSTTGAFVKACRPTQTRVPNARSSVAGSNTSAGGPARTMRPAARSTTRSQYAAARLRSCRTESTPTPCSRQSW